MQVRHPGDEAVPPPPPASPVHVYLQQDQADTSGASAAVVQALKAGLPGAQAVRVGLPSPAGQLEVWLVKASGV